MELSEKNLMQTLSNFSRLFKQALAFADLPLSLHRRKDCTDRFAARDVLHTFQEHALHFACARPPRLRLCVRMVRT